MTVLLVLESRACLGMVCCSLGFIASLDYFFLLVKLESFYLTFLPFNPNC